ncbi:glutathione S-transferase family protein [Bartonella sp. HY761]|uniref:glutathione S-transferase family protein n=1 Tax=Bartonella sp. HY761 TaxID=2979330 RepID=UPI00220C2D46|nr:glutathione S-transferase family protein [Bartonella sp. HY761]UXN06099.1 glutathione S-transferase family protein [Bartonella sp. HY761]
MILIGQLDSPYVRRVAISAAFMGFKFERKNLSVFRDIPEFSTYNPVLKSPSFVSDDDIVLMDSTLIIQYLEAQTQKQRSLLPKDNLALELRIIGLALAASDKSVQIEYEEKRPISERSPNWLARIIEQMLSAFSLLEQEYQKISTPWLHGEEIMQSDITTAIALNFSYNTVPDLITKQSYPALNQHWQRAEMLDIFKQYPYC